jgi:hypothetical protein
MRADAIAVSALIVLAGCLSGHTELDGNLRPSDTEDHCVIDQQRQLRVCLVPREPCTLDPFEQLGW